MTDAPTSIESIRAMMRAAAHPLDVMDPRQIAAKLVDAGYSPRTAANAAEVACAVAATLRTGLPVPPRWGFGD